MDWSSGILKRDAKIFGGVACGKKGIALFGVKSIECCKKMLNDVIIFCASFTVKSMTGQLADSSFTCHSTDARVDVDLPLRCRYFIANTHNWTRTLTCNDIITHVQANNRIKALQLQHYQRQTSSSLYSPCQCFRRPMHLMSASWARCLSPNVGEPTLSRTEI